MKELTGTFSWGLLAWAALALGILLIGLKKTLSQGAAQPAREAS